MFNLHWIKAQNGQIVNTLQIVRLGLRTDKPSDTGHIVAEHPSGATTILSNALPALTACTVLEMLHRVLLEGDSATIAELVVEAEHNTSASYADVEVRA